MGDGMLSLAWNNHSSTFCHMLSNLREMEKYTDATVACEGKFYGVHKLVLASCSEYFFKMFEETPCKHPIVVLKDIQGKEIEALLSYMYDGVVSVSQCDLARLINAAEVLQIKGLAVPDEPPKARKKASHARSSSDDRASPQPKRTRREAQGSSSNNRSRDRPSTGGSERTEFRNITGTSTVDIGINGVQTPNETAAVEEIDRSRTVLEESEVKAIESDIETISIESGIKEEVSIEAEDDLQETPFEFGAANQGLELENNSGLKDLVNLELGGSFSSPTEGFDTQAVPSAMDLWGNTQEEMPDHAFSGDSVAGPSGSQDTTSGKDQAGSKRKGGSKNRNSRFYHSFNNVWHCSFCPYSSNSDDELMAHISTHTGSFIEVRKVKGKKKYACKMCTYIHHTEYGVRVHLRSHTGEKPFPCPLCPKRFSQKIHLKSHLVRHTGERPFQCSVCLAKFNRKGSLKRHVLVHQT